MGGAGDEMGPMLERDDVLARIADAVAAADAGRGGTIVVEGAPGLGKTTVLRAALDAARAPDRRVAVARGGELEQSLPWAIVRDLLRAPAAAVPSLVGPVAGAVLGLGGGRVSDEVAALFELAELCTGLVAERPLVLAVDDVHWADRSSARFLTYLAARAADLSLLLVLAARPDDPRRPDELAALSGQDTVTTLTLQPLSPEGTAVLLTAELPDVSPAVVEACHRATTGNLFLLTELTRELRGTGVAPTADAIEGLEIRSVDRAVARRLAAAGGPAATLAEAAAVIGQGAALADAAAVAGLGYADAALAADQLRAAGLIATEEAGASALTFGHPLLLAAVRRAVAPGRRSLLHLTAARHLDAAGAAIDRVGAHLVAAEPGDDPWVRGRLVAAADAALDAGAPLTAVALLQRAIAERVGQDATLLTQLGRAALPVDPALAEGPLRAALRLLDDPAARVEVALVLSVALQMLRRSGEATDMLLALEAELGGPRHRRARLRVQAEALAQSFFDPRTRGLRAERLPGLLAELDGSCDEELLIRVHRAIEASEDTAEEVRELADEAWAGGRLEQIAGAPETPTVMWIPYLRMYTDDAAWSAALMHEWIAAARERGSVVLAAFAHTLLAHALRRMGDLRDAAAAATTGWELAREFGPGFPAWWIALGVRADVELAAGRATGARALLEEGGLLDGPPQEVMLMPAPRVVRGEVLCATGELERGVEELRAAWDWIAEYTRTGSSRSGPVAVPPGSWWFQTRLVDGLLALGRRPEARALAETWHVREASFGARSVLGQAQRAMGLTVDGDDGMAWLQTAVATLAASPARSEHARALLDLGAALRRSRRAKEAREPLREALDLAVRCGADGLAESARVELVAAGARPRRDALTGADALTASERRVVQLAAEGRTNREIANTLFVSQKTVERHLGNAYLKLGTNRRHELAGLLGDG